MVVICLLAALGSAAAELPTPAAELPTPAGTHLNASSFFDRLDGTTERWFVLFFSPHCGHCHAMLPAWAELAEQLTVDDAARLAAIDATEEKVLADRLDVNGFPTLLAVEANTIYEYDGGRSAEEMGAFIRSTDLAAVARGARGRALPRAPSRLDPLLDAPNALLEIVGFAVQTSPIAAVLIAATLIAIGALIANASREHQFIMVDCPAGVQPGQSFAVEFAGARRLILRGGRRRHMSVVVPSGVAPGQTFFVPLVPTPRVRPVAPPPPPPPAEPTQKKRN